MDCRRNACSLHSPGDVAIHEFFNRQSVESVPPEKREEWERFRQDQLDLMRRYAYGAGCRQQAIMDYFGDAEKLPQGCGRCDNCQTPEAPPVDAKTQETVRILLSGAARLRGRFGGSQLADLVTGSESEQIRKYQPSATADVWTAEIDDQAAGSGDDSGARASGIFATGGLALSGAGDHRRGPGGHARSSATRDWGRGSRPGREKPGGSRRSGLRLLLRRLRDEVPGGLREALREWRAAKSKELGVPPYTIFWDRTLDELCRQRPGTAGELLTIWGIGDAKQRMFGAELLALIGEDRLA